MADDITRRLQDLVAYPREDLDVEVKSWLDLSDQEARADLAQAMLALANHGGGYVIVGMTESAGAWSVDSPRPPSLAPYSQDTVNEILHRYAEPVFHAQLFHVAHPTTGDVFPVVVVPGGHRVPIRSKSASPSGKHVRNNVYYIRRPGPASEAPQSGREWDELIARCVRAAREDLIDRIRDAVLGIERAGTASAPRDRRARLDEWFSSSRQRLDALLAERLPDERPSRYALGTWSCGYAVQGEFERPSLAALRTILAQAQGRETGWPMWRLAAKPESAPYAWEGTIESWFGDAGRDGAHSDYWRASPEGLLFLLRGYQEDAMEDRAKPGTRFDPRLPVWRTGEALLHAARTATALAGESASVIFRAEWSGLAGRQLAEIAGSFLRSLDRTARQDRVAAEVEVSVEQIEQNLPEVARDVTRPLYDAFDFYTPTPELIVAELDRMRARSR